MARKVDFKINRAKTEFTMVGNRASPVELCVSTGTINLVKVLVFRIRTKNVETRKALAWKACIRVVKIWKSSSIFIAVKTKLFRACVESTLLYNSVTWTLTEPLSRKFDGCYTKLLRYALNHKWIDYAPNSIL
jgi:hypothetical protein